MNRSTCNTRTHTLTLADSVQWVIFPQTLAGEALEDWMRTVGITRSGKIYVTAALAAREAVVELMATEDGVTTLRYHGHLYAPCGWLGTNFTNVRAICRAITSMVYTHHIICAAGEG